MRRTSGGAILADLCASPAFSLAVSEVDTDGDSQLSFSDMLMSFPELTKERFVGIDTSGDNRVDETELAAAFRAGMIV